MNEREKMLSQMSEEERYYAKESVETEIGQELSDEEFDAMATAWHAFATDPREYSGGIVIDMVELWLKGFRESH